MTKTSLVMGLAMNFLSLMVTAQESWVGSIDSLKAFPTAYVRGITQVAPLGGGFVATLVEGSAKDGFNALAGLDGHGNLLWMYQDTDQMYQPVFVPLANGDILYFQGYATNENCRSGGSNLFEVAPNGQVVRQKFGEIGLASAHDAANSFQRRNGDILLDGGSILLEMKSDLSAILWAEYLAPPSGDPALINGVMENDDGTLSVLGQYTPSGVPGSYYRPFLAKVGDEGVVLSYTIYDMDSSKYEVALNSIQPAQGGGYWLSGGVGYSQSSDLVSAPYLAKVTASGDVEWEETLCIAGKCTAGGFSAALPTANGGLVASGGAQGPPLDPQSGFVVSLDADGQPQWLYVTNDTSIPAPNFEMIFSQLLELQDGFLAVSDGTEGLAPAWLFRSNKQGRLADACQNYVLSPEASTVRQQVLVPYSDTIQAHNNNYFSLCDSTATLKMKDLLSTATICGDAFPAVVSAQTLQSPFRLKFTGWNFQDGSVAFINGIQAPSATFKGTDSKTYQTRMVIGGGNKLKALLPKGQSACITIQNPDGHQSDCFAFTR